MNQETENAIFLCIICVLMVFDALVTLMSIFNKGLKKTNKLLPIKRTQTELKRMLKKDLVELVIQYQ